LHPHADRDTFLGTDMGERFGLALQQSNRNPAALQFPMDTLYVLCRSVDHRYAPPLDAADVEAAVAQKSEYFTVEADANPLVQEILAGGRVSFEGIAAVDKHAFLRGPATFFRTHEILRKTFAANTPITIGTREYSREDVAVMFERCVPNSKLELIPWCSLGRYRVSLGLAWGATLLTAHITARGNESEVLLDPFVLYYMGSTTTIAALTYTTVKQNRDVRCAAAWNSAMYLDLNADLLRRNCRALAVARKEYVPQETPFKTTRFYYALARKVESHGFDAELTKRLATSPPTKSELGNAHPA